MMATLDEYLAQIRGEAPQGTQGVLTGYTPTAKPVQYGESVGFANFDPTTGQPVVQDNAGRWRYQVPGGPDENGTPTNAWGGYADIGTIAPEFNSAGDVYRVKTTDPNRFYGGAGAGHAYDYYQYVDPTADQIANGAWQLFNPGEHLEEENYRWAGLNSQAYTDAFKNQFAGTTLSPLEQARLSMPGALGQAVTRSESSLTGGNNEDDARQELAFYMAQPGMMEKLQGVFTPAQMAAAQDQISQSSASAQASRDTDDGFGDLMKLAALAAAIYTGGSALGAWGGLGAEAGLGAAELGGALAGSESAALGSLGSGLSGVELAGAGLYGQTPLTMGTLGSGLAGTTAGSLGLDAAMLGGLGAGAVGADALTSLPASLETAGSTLNSTGLPYGQTMANAPSSLDTIINNAISTGSQGYPYVDPLSTGSITGVSGLPSSGALESLGGLGLDASVGSGLEAAVSGTANESMSLWDRLLSNPSSLLNAASSASNLAGGGSRLLESLGVPSNLAGGALGLLSWLALRDQRNNQTSQNASNVAALRSPAFNAPLNPTAFAGPQMRNVMGATPSTPRQNVPPTWNQPIRRAEGGALSRMSNNTAGPSMGGYAAGGTKGQDDKIPALFSDGEYVFDADSVAALGDGNNAAGAAVLDKMRENIRRHKRSAPAHKIPPKAKSPEAYMKGAK